MEKKQFDLSDDKIIHPGFYEKHQNELKLLAVLSSKDDSLQWGILTLSSEYYYDGGYSAKYRISKKFKNLSSGSSYADQYPIIIYPFTQKAKSACLKLIDDTNENRDYENVPSIHYDKIYYCSSNGEVSYTQYLNSKLEISLPKDKSGKKIEIKDKSELKFLLQIQNDENDETGQVCFWLFKLKKGESYEFRIPLPENQLDKENINRHITIEKEILNNIPKFKFVNDFITWDNNHKIQIRKESSSPLYSISYDFTSLFDREIVKETGFQIVNQSEIKIRYYKEKPITSIQFNNDIYVQYIKDANNLLYKAFTKVTAIKDALVETRKSQPFALLPKFTNKYGYTLYAHYKVEQDVFTLISTEIKNATFEISDIGKKDSFTITPLRAKDKSKDEKIVISDISDYPEVNDNGTFARLIIGNYQIKEPKPIYDGALEFELGTEAKYSGTPYDHNGKISFALQRASTQKPLFLWEWDGTMNDLEIGYSIEDFSIPIKSVKPVSQDLTTGEKYLAPSSTEAIVNGYGERLQKQLIIPMPEKEDDKKENEYYLCISESVNIGQDFRVDMRLIEVNPKAGEDQTKRIKTIVLDSSPQFVGLVDSNFLMQRGYDDGVWVLAQKIQNNLNEGVWEVFDDQSNKDGFNLMLPAQTIGEEYIKDDSVYDGTEKKSDGSGGFEKSSFPLPYKFGAPAILKIAGDKLEKNYVAPPWDLRRLWGTAGDILPGSPLLRAEFELLYGLQADLKPKNTLIAELGARLGDLPVPINNNLAWQATSEQIEAFYQNWINYLKYYRAWKSRLAILETYRANEPEVEATFVAPNMVNEELDYKPRLKINVNKGRAKIHNEKTLLSKRISEIDDNLKTAGIEESVTLNRQKEEIKEQINHLEEQLSKLEFPYVQGFLKGAQLTIPDKEFDNETIIIDDTDISLDTFHEDVHGSSEHFLKGGFTYGFQDKEIYKSFLQKALTEGSTSAELSGLAFSSQGGYGKQVARFDNDLTAIKSLTSMGRVHRYAVERIGRIGVFWHKAKHVIEYERTVVRSEYEKEYQNPLSGRPIVRKIREYIEILEPEKKYPDFENHSPKDTGALNTCVFKSTIIPISNSWGKIVYKGDEPMGWEVPLWYEGADETLFPKPQIFFLLEPPKDANLNHSTAQLAEPQNLVFYTAYFDGEKGKEPDKDVSTWKSVYGVDFTDKPVFDESVLQPCMPPDNDKNRLDKPMPNAIDVLPGHGRFTFRVEPQQTPAGMASVYQPDSGLSGVMRTVSLQRNGEIEISNNRIEENLKSLLRNALNGSFRKKEILDTIKNEIDNLDKNPNLSNFNELTFPKLDSWISKTLLSKILVYSSHFIEIARKKKEIFEQKLEGKTKDEILAGVDNLFFSLSNYELEIVEYKDILQRTLSFENGRIEELRDYKKTLLAAFTNDKKVDQLKNEITSVCGRLKSTIDKIAPITEKDSKDGATKLINAIEQKLNQIDTNPEDYLSKIQNSIKESIEEFDIVKFIDKALRFLVDAEKEINEISLKLKKAKNEFQTQVDLDFTQFLNNTFTGTEGLIYKLVTNVLVGHVFPTLLAIDGFIIQSENEFLSSTTKRLEKLFGDINDDEKIKDFYANVSEYISLAASKYDLAVVATASGNEALTATQNVLTNYRSVWEEITAPGMGLNRKTIALIVNKVENAKQLEQQLSITPCIAKYKQFESDLNALGVRLPVTHIFNELKAPTEEWLEKKSGAIKDAIKKIQFPESLTNLGAMDFSSMFKGFELPPDFTKHVKFSQGLDKENLSAWAKADLDYKMPDPTEPMFSISVASVWLSNAHLTAHIEGNANADGVVTKKEYGELLGDFAIKIGSNPLITFEQTKVIYKDGKLDFDLDPSRMKMDGVLKMITDATQNLNQFNTEAKSDQNAEQGEENSDKPFKIKILKATIDELVNAPNYIQSKQGEAKTDPEKVKEELSKFENQVRQIEVPYGVKATLDIPAISVGGGTTSMTNLSFGGQFVLRFFNPEVKQLEFVTGLGFYIGKREAPFNFTAFIFGGGGFVDTLIYYSADTGTEIDFTMSIHASAGLFFNVGWASGSVFIYLGLEGQYSYRNQIGSSMTFVLFVQMVGTLHIMGMVSVYLIVRLALSYEGYRMIGTGYISVSIKICWCLTIRVSRSFSKQFTGSKQEPKKQQTSISASLG